LTDETFAVLKSENVPELTLEKLMDLKEKEMSREELLREIAKVLNADDQERWKRSIQRHASFGLAGVVPYVASVPLGSSSLLTPFSDGSVVVMPMPGTPAAEPEPKPKAP
jgi:hypothetical protein